MGCGRGGIFGNGFGSIFWIILVIWLIFAIIDD